MLETIRKWKINLPLLADKMGLEYSTFFNKYDGNQPKYAFTEVELLKLRGILNQLSDDFKIV